MNFVDTSIWIHCLRLSGSGKILEEIAPLIRGGNVAITDWIILELMVGLRSNESPSTLLEFLAPIHRLPIAEDGWGQAWNLAARLRKKGVTTSASDCLIATIAIAHEATLIHCDADFELIAKHEKRLQTLDWTKLL